MGGEGRGDGKDEVAKTMGWEAKRGLQGRDIGFRGAPKTAKRDPMEAGGMSETGRWWWWYIHGTGGDKRERKRHVWGMFNGGGGGI